MLQEDSSPCSWDDIIPCKMFCSIPQKVKLIKMWCECFTQNEGHLACLGDTWAVPLKIPDAWELPLKLNSKK